MVTTRRRATSWYLSPRTVGLPTPRLSGDVGPSRIFVARWEDANGRGSFTPWLDVQLEQAAGGGTTLGGRIGLYPAAGELLAILDGIFGLAAVALVPVGTALLVQGNLRGLVLMLVPLSMAVLAAGITISGLRSLERGIPKLIQEVNGVLNSTATFTGPAA